MFALRPEADIWVGEPISRRAEGHLRTFLDMPLPDGFHNYWRKGVGMFLDVDGNKVFALSFGKGPRTFLAHSGWIGNFEDWIAVLAPLSETWRTIIYDHRGTGETPVPVEKITDEALVDDVFRVMDALGVDQCVLGGFSRGSITALRAVLKDPTRFEGLVLMNGTGGVQRPDAAPRPRVAPSQWPGETFRERLSWFIERSTPEEGVEHIRRWGVNILSRSSPEAADKLFTMQPTDSIDWASRLSQLQLPTLIIHGEKDWICDTETMRYLQSLIPESKLVLLEGSGHVPAMTRPWTFIERSKTILAPSGLASTVSR